MYQNTEIHTVNTDGIFSQEDMDTWQAADWDVKENKTREGLKNFGNLKTI